MWRKSGCWVLMGELKKKHCISLLVFLSFCTFFFIFVFLLGRLKMPLVSNPLCPSVSAFSFVFLSPNTIFWIISYLCFCICIFVCVYLCVSVFPCLELRWVISQGYQRWDIQCSRPLGAGGSLYPVHQQRPKHTKD